MVKIEFENVGESKTTAAAIPIGFFLDRDGDLSLKVDDETVVYLGSPAFDEQPFRYTLTRLCDIEVTRIFTSEEVTIKVSPCK